MEGPVAAIAFGFLVAEKVYKSAAWSSALVWLLAGLMSNCVAAFATLFSIFPKNVVNTLLSIMLSETVLDLV